MPSLEEIRAQRMQANKDMLSSLGISTIVAPPVQKLPATPKPAAPKTFKRALPSPSESDSSSQTGSTGNRSSARLRSKANGERDAPSSSPELVSLDLGYVSDEERTVPLPVHRPNPKVFGHIRGVPVGTWWPTRVDCSRAAVHAPTVAGISGSESQGAWSIAVSGGYGDHDAGYAFTYSGCGGRDLKGTPDKPKNLRTAAQTFDQDWSGLNGALRTSAKTGKPVRVIRGYKGTSPFAPLSGYRYEGLYVVKKAWMDVGESGFKVTRFAFQRLAGQPKIPVAPGRGEEAEQLVAELGNGGAAPPTPKSEEDEQETPSKRRRRR